MLVINKAWFLAARPKTLGAMLCPILLGHALAIKAGQFNLLTFLLILSASMALQILANIVNDYGDFLHGRDTINRLGPPRAMSMGLISEHDMQKAILLLITIISIIGIYISYLGGWIIFLLGLLSLVMAIYYTLGSKPISHLGLGELTVWFFFGPLPVLGSYYLQVFELSCQAFFISLAPAFLSCALMLTNNLRDMAEDYRVNKNTLAVRIGEKYSRYLILIFILCSSLSVCLTVIFFNYKLLTLLSLLAFIYPIKSLSIIFKEPISKRYNILLANIGYALYVLGIIYGTAIIL